MYIIFLVMYFLFVFVITVVNKSNKIKWFNKLFLFLFIVVYCIFIAARSTEIIPDMYSYQTRYYGALTALTYNDILTTNILSKVTYYSMGVGASLISYFFADIGFSFSVFSALIGGIVIYLFVSISILLLEEFGFEIDEVFLYFESIVLFGLYYQFIAWPQGIAMLFVLFSFYFAIKKKIFLMVVMIVLSMTFHLVGFAAVLLIGLYRFMPVLKNNIYKVLWLSTGFLAFSGFGYKISFVAEFVVSKVLEIVINYNELYLAYDTFENSGRLSVAFIAMWIYIGIIIFEDRLSNIGYKLLNILIIMQMISVVFQSWSIMHRITDLLFLIVIYVGCDYIKRNRSMLKLKSGNRLLMTGEECVCYMYVIIKFITVINIFRSFSVL